MILTTNNILNGQGMNEKAFWDEPFDLYSSHLEVLLLVKIVPELVSVMILVL